jgi:hypothetical protein
MRTMQRASFLGRTENPRVGGSTPSQATTYSRHRDFTVTKAESLPSGRKGQQMSNGCRMPAKEKPMRLLLAVLTTMTLAGPLAADEPDQQIPARVVQFIPKECIAEPHQWLRKPTPYELGDLSWLGPWRVYLVAEGQDTTTLEYGAWGWGETQPLSFGAVSGWPEVIELRSHMYPWPGMFYWLWAINQDGECSLRDIMVPYDHGYGQ